MKDVAYGTKQYKATVLDVRVLPSFKYCDEISERIL